MTRHETLRPVFVQDTIPKPLEEGVLYISLYYELAIHLCACGECGIETVTPLTPEHGWGLTWEGPDDARLVTLSPSIGNQQFPCGSHYFIRKNKVVWL